MKTNMTLPMTYILTKSPMSTQECQRTRTLATEIYKAVNGMTSSYIQVLCEVKDTS